MIMFDTPPVTITAMTEKELRQDNWRLKGKIDKLTAQIEVLKAEPPANHNCLIGLNNALANENKRLRKLLGMQQIVRVGSPEEILEAICNFYSVTLEQLKSSSRKKAIANPRHLAAYVLQSKGFSYKHIGHIFGNRDHSTMIHAKKHAMIMIDKMEEAEQNFIFGLMK